jgi:hypothetical protein
MMKRPIRFLLLALALLPAACGDYPEPMMGYPGRMGMILAHPPPQRIVVPVPHRALLDDTSASVFATDLTNALVAQTIPAFAQKPDRGDWILATTATLTGDLVTPTYFITDPRGHVQGRITGTPVPSSAWANGDAATLSQTATAAAPRLASLLSDIDAALKENDPHSLYNRPPRVEFFGMKGAPGDGDEGSAGPGRDPGGSARHGRLPRARHLEAIDGRRQYPAHRYHVDGADAGRQGSRQGHAAA